MKVQEKSTRERRRHQAMQVAGQCLSLLWLVSLSWALPCGHVWTPALTACPFAPISNPRIANHWAAAGLKFSFSFRLPKGQIMWSDSVVSSSENLYRFMHLDTQASRPCLSPPACSQTSIIVYLETSTILFWDSVTALYPEKKGWIWHIHTLHRYLQL
jgi:hypothetical protein